MLLRQFISKTAFIMAIVAGVFTGVQPTAGARPNGLQPVDNDQLDERISFASDSSIFPESWREAPFHVTAEPIADQQQRARARRLVRTAVRKYLRN